jgi:methionine-rich copper-binding protein CopC
MPSGAALLFTGLLVLGLAAAPAPAQEAPRMIEAHPAARSVMAGQHQEFFVRFDSPVDHGGARLTLTRGGEVVREPRPRLGAQPNTLHASAGGLQPGEYRLEWRVTSPRGGPASTGGLDVTLR